MRNVTKPVYTEQARADIQCLHTQLEQLATHHYEALKEEEVLNEVEKLIKLLERFEEGSGNAERELYGQGREMLEQVKSKLKLALEEELRIVDESPAAAATTKGRKSERYTEAEKQANEALTTLEHLAEHKIH